MVKSFMGRRRRQISNLGNTVNKTIYFFIEIQEEFLHLCLPSVLFKNLSSAFLNNL